MTQVTHSHRGPAFQNFNWNGQLLLASLRVQSCLYFHTMLLLSHIISTIKIFFLFMCLHFFSTAKTGVLQGTRPPRTEEGRELYRNAALPMHTAPICTNNTASTVPDITVVRSPPCSVECGIWSYHNKQWQVTWRNQIQTQLSTPQCRSSHAYNTNTNKGSRVASEVRDQFMMLHLFICIFPSVQIYISNLSPPIPWVIVPQSPSPRGQSPADPHGQAPPSSALAQGSSSSLQLSPGS